MEDINFKNIPDAWDNVSDDDDQIVNNLVRLDISNRERLYQQELDGDGDGEDNGDTSIVQSNNPVATTTLKFIEEEQEKEEPLLLINFTKWSYDKIRWRNGVIENNDLFQRLLEKLNQDSEFFVMMTDDLMERELAFHTTNRTWRTDIKQLEEQYGSTNFFSVISYPPIVGGFLVDEIWSKIKERTEWKSVNILKCIYLAKTNRPLLYKHQMAISIEFMALEQKLLGPTAKRLIDEEEKEYQLQLKQYQERMQKLYENEINEGIIKNLQQQIYLSEGMVNNIDRINNINQITNQKLRGAIGIGSGSGSGSGYNDSQDEDEDQDEYNSQDEDEEYSYCSTCNGSDDEDYSGDEMVDDDDDNNNNNNNSSSSNNNNSENQQEEDNKSTTTSSYEQSDDDDADNELEEEDTRKKKKEMLIEQRKIKEIEAEKVLKQREKERLKSEEPPPPPSNILDKIMAMIFSKLLIQSNSKEYHYQMLSKLQDSIKESWISELGLLPPSALWRDNPLEDD